MGGLDEVGVAIGKLQADMEEGIRQRSKLFDLLGVIRDAHAAQAEAMGLMATQLEDIKSLQSVVDRHESAYQRALGVAFLAGLIGAAVPVGAKFMGWM